MGPSFTTEIGRMRTQEAIARAEHYRLTKMAARKSPEPEGRVVTERRRSFLSWRRLAAVVTAGMFLSLAFATAALAVPTGGGGGGAGYVPAPETVATPPSTDLTMLFLGGIAVVVAVAAGIWVMWSERRVPKLA